MKSRNQISMQLVLFLSALAMSPVVAAPSSPQKIDKTKIENEPAEVWRDPGDVSALNLFYGPGGKDHAPDPNGTFEFVKEDMNGTSPKFDVKDEKGVEWRVKLGEEPRSETAATRLLWAAGYFADEDYFLPDFKVQGLSKLRRGGSMVSADGSVHQARLKRHIKNVKKVGNWDWFHNQCGSSREFNGLRILMAFVNNWDLKTENNSLEESNGELRCLVTDVGATFGKTGNPMARSKSEEKDYTGSNFIAKTTPQYVDFVMHSRPFFLSVFDLPNYRERTRMENITKHIPVADAKWLEQRLTLLSADQIQDCFRAAGYSQNEIEGYTKAVQDRVAELNAL